LIEPALKRIPTGNATYVRFEDFTDKDRQMGTLERMMKFLSYRATADRIGCAFKLAEGYLGKGIKTSGISTTSSSSSGVDVKHAVSLLSGEAACTVWKNVEPYATYFKYSPPWGNSSCHDFGKTYSVNSVRLSILLNSISSFGLRFF
jgi:hypothetical protein